MLGPGEEHGILPSHKWLQLRAVLVLQTGAGQGRQLSLPGGEGPQEGRQSLQLT